MEPNAIVNLITGGSSAKCQSAVQIYEVSSLLHKLIYPLADADFSVPYIALSRPALDMQHRYSHLLVSLYTLMLGTLVSRESAIV